MTTAARAVAHTGFTVPDLDGAIAFWSGVLGFTVERRAELTGDFAAGVTGVAGAHIAIAVLELAGQRLELLQYLAPDQRSLSSPAPCDTGAAHLALEVAEFDAVVAACREHGWTLAGPPQQMPHGPRAGTRFAYLHSRDGLTLELIQPPA